MSDGYSWRSRSLFPSASRCRQLANKYAKQQKANKAAKKARRRNRGK